jgi:hypothetical protein
MENINLWQYTIYGNEILLLENIVKTQFLDDNNIFVCME